MRSLSDNVVILAAYTYMFMKQGNRLALILAGLTSAGATFGQEKTLTHADYAKAEQMLSYNTQPLVYNDLRQPMWVDGQHFWYAVAGPEKTSYVWIDAAKKSKTSITDSKQLIAALQQLTGKSVTEKEADVQRVVQENGSFKLLINRNWYLLSGTKLAPTTTGTALSERENTGGRRFRQMEVISPDGRKAVYIDQYNLWLKNLATGEKKQLTFDGVKNYGYATDNAGWKHSDAPILRWSPDSRKITTFQMDEREVGDMYLVTTNVGHPTLKAWKYPLPGDSVVAMIERVVIDTDNGKTVRLKMSPDFHRGTLSDDISSSGTFDDIDWNPDGSEFAFVSTSRDHKNEKVRIANTADGTVREVFEETVPTQFESGRNAINWRYLAASNEFIWYSERDDWGHLYLYDAKTGQLKNQITKGEWLVADLVKVDEKARKLYFTAAGLQAQNPYFQSFCSVDFSGKNFKVLTPETGNHQITFGPGESYFVDKYSQPDVAPVTVLRDLKGNKITELEKADVSALTASGWRAPVPVKLKAGDGKTDVYGLLFQPAHTEPGKKYPVIDYIYPGPQGGSVGSWSFSPSRGDNNALSELGFYVLVLEGTSNPYRSKSYHDMSYGNMSINTLPDQVAAIRQLSATYAIDTAKVGIWGHSGGGFATATAMFKYPDFFKVGISESGNHDNRNYEDDWGERYDGLAQNVDYAAQANQLYAKNLKGKLLIAHGLLDDNVPPYNSLLVIEALEKANKDYDLIIFPNSPHGYGPYSYYMMRRRWDYFVKNLLGATPPKEYELGPKK